MQIVPNNKAIRDKFYLHNEYAYDVIRWDYGEVIELDVDYLVENDKGKKVWVSDWYCKEV